LRPPNYRIYFGLARLLTLQCPLANAGGGLRYLSSSKSFLPLWPGSSRAYNVSLRGVRGAIRARRTPPYFSGRRVSYARIQYARIPCARIRDAPRAQRFAKELGHSKPSARHKNTTMSDPLAKIKKKLQDEIDQLSHELSVELPKEIAVARAHGDLSENAEYKFAKERQTYVNAKIAQLKKRMGDLGMLNLNNIPKDRSGYGSRIVVIDVARDVKVEYKLVSSEEADAEKGLISTTSPIGRALLNRKVGDEIEVATPAGKKEFEVVQLMTIHDGD
jgi:transcription elongation factor GreA